MPTNARSLLLAAGITGLVPAFIACSGDVSGGNPAPAEPDAGEDGAGGSAGCAGATAAAMVALPHGFSIDSTEVTRCQYHAWLDAKPSVLEQDPWCVWNTDFQPAYWESGSPPSYDGDLPIGWVDWCDAYAYCKGVGKRLCGRIGGGPNAMDDYADADKSQWYDACSSGGKYYYTYGDPYDYGSKCNDSDRGNADYTPVGSLPACQSPDPQYAGVYDMNGNVWEFEDSCDAQEGSADTCHKRGGSNLSPEVYSSCGFRSGSDRDLVAGNIGFRCCSQ